MRRRPPQTAFHMLRLFTLVIVTALLPLPSPVQAQVTLFDTLGIKHLRLGREFLFRFAGATGENEADFRTNQRRNVRVYLGGGSMENKCNNSFPSSSLLNCRNYRSSFLPMNPSFVMCMGRVDEVQFLLSRCINCVPGTLILWVQLATV